MNEEIFILAAQTMKTSLKKVKTHYKEIPEINAYYFWNPVKGGISVIINDACEKLGAVSTVNYEKHLEAFTSGKRN